MNLGKGIKKVLSINIVIIILLGFFSGCTENATKEKTKKTLPKNGDFKIIGAYKVNNSLDASIITEQIY